MKGVKEFEVHNAIMIQTEAFHDECVTHLLCFMCFLRCDFFRNLIKSLPIKALPLLRFNNNSIRHMLNKSKGANAAGSVAQC